MKARDSMPGLALVTLLGAASPAGPAPADAVAFRFDPSAPPVWIGDVAVRREVHRLDRGGEVLSYPIVGVTEGVRWETDIYAEWTLGEEAGHTILHGEQRLRMEYRTGADGKPESTLARDPDGGPRSRPGQPVFTIAGNEQLTLNVDPSTGYTIQLFPGRPVAGGAVSLLWTGPGDAMQYPALRAGERASVGPFLIEAVAIQADAGDSPASFTFRVVAAPRISTPD